MMLRARNATDKRKPSLSIFSPYGLHTGYRMAVAENFAVDSLVDISLWQIYDGTKDKRTGGIDVS
jgi:hypothetical protein